MDTLKLDHAISKALQAQIAAWDALSEVEDAWEHTSDDLSEIIRNVACGIFDDEISQAAINAVREELEDRLREDGDEDES